MTAAPARPSAALVHEVRLLKKAGEITREQMEALLGITRPAPKFSPETILAGLSEEDKAKVSATLKDWLATHPARAS
jgi:hypothetical protein